MQSNILLISVQEDIEIIGLKYLHYTLMKNNLRSHLLYLPDLRDKGLRYVYNFVRDVNPIFVGISLMSHEYNKAQTLTHYLKKNFNVPVIWGGIHPTISPEMCLEEADYVCIGEGEKVIVDLARKIGNGGDVRGINNLCYLSNGHMIQNNLYPPIEDLDSIPFYDFIPKESYIQNNNGQIVSYEKIFKKYSRFRKQYSVISSRGCPFSCTYCCNNFLFKLYPSHKVRRRSVENIIRELKKVVDERDIELISFQDDCFLSNNYEYIEEFCREYKKKVNKPFSAHGIPIYVTKEKIELLADAGLSWVNIGLQSGSDHVNCDIYNRKSSKKDFLRAARIIKENGVAAFCDLILDNPFETESDALETINTMMEAPKPFYPQLFSLNLYMGTELYEKAKRECSDKVEDFCEKNYSFYRKNVINKMIRLSIFLPPKWMKVIVEQYQKDPKGMKFKSLFFGANILSSGLLEFIAYFEIIRLSCKGSYIRTIFTLPNYFKRAIWAYFNQFRKV